MHLKAVLPLDSCKWIVYRYRKRNRIMRTHGLSRAVGVLLACVIGNGGRAATLTPQQDTVLDSSYAGDSCWDVGRSALYYSAPAAKQVRKVNLATGGTIGQITFAFAPEKMALSPDGSELYVVLPVMPHSDTWFDNQWGYVAVVNPETMTEIRQIQVQIDPYDVAIPTDGVLVVSGGSGQWTNVDTYDATSGDRLGSTTGVIRQGSRLIAHADGQRVYVVGEGGLQRLYRDAMTGAYLGHAQPVYTGAGSPVRAWLNPAGDLFIGQQGTLYSCDADPQEDLQIAGTFDACGIAVLGFAVSQHGFLTADNCGVAGQINQYHLDTFALAQTHSVEGRVLAIEAATAMLRVISEFASGEIHLLQFANPVTGGDVNSSPMAAFTWNPSTPTTISPIMLDASSSQDDQPALVPLMYRWDFDGDGMFDSGFSTNALAETSFSIGGTYPVVLQVKDQFGALGSVTNAITVLTEEDPGTVPTSIPSFQLPFVVADVAFDPARRRLYATDTAGQSLWVMDLDSGAAVRRFSFFRQAESLAMTPDGAKLYVALLDRPHDSFRFIDEGSGRIAVFDLDRLVKTHEFAVNVDPGRIAAFDSRLLMIGGGSNQSTLMECRDASTGELLDTKYYNQFAPLLALPENNLVIWFQRYFSSAQANYYEVNPVTGALSERLDLARNIDSARAAGVTVNATHTRLASGDGSVFRLSPSGAIEGEVTNLEGNLMSATLFDAPERGMLFGARDLDLMCFNLDTLQLVTTRTLSYPAIALGRLDENLYAVERSNGKTYVEIVPNPAWGSENNQAPAVLVTRTPDPATTIDTIQFDAFGTIDDQDAAGSLEYRWDVDGDGFFDTEWSGDPVLTRRFLVAGTYSISAEARDRWRAVGSLSTSFPVVLATDPGEPGLPHEPWRLPRAAADVAFDPLRGKLWLSDSNHQAIVKVDLASGLEERRWSFNLPPESLALTGGGTRLYAALLAHPHDYYWRDQVGYVAEFDLATDTMVRVHQFDIDPGDISATDTGYLFIAGGSGGDTAVRCYRVSDGALRGSVPMYNGPRLAVAPSQSQVFAATYWDPNSRITRFSFDPSTGAFGAGNMTASYSAVGGNVFVLPGESQLLSGAGAIFEADTLAATANLGAGSVTDMAPLLTTNWFATISGTSIRYHESGTLNPSGVFALGYAPRFVGSSGAQHFTVSVTNQWTVIRRRTLPSDGPGSNLAPVVHWLSSPDNQVYAAPASVSLAVQPEDEDGGIDRVQFWSGTQLLGERQSFPYSLTLNESSSGIRSVSAIAIDNLGATSEVAQVQFRVTSRPQIFWLGPAQPAVFDAGAAVPLTVQAQDADGTVQAVRFYRTSVAPANLLAELTGPPWTLVEHGFDATTTYFAEAVDNDGVTSQPASTLVQLAGAEGDEFYRPFVLTGTHVTVTADNSLATGQLFEPTIAGSPASHSLWWEWVAPTSGIYRIQTAGSSFDTVLGVFQGSNIQFAIGVVANDDSPDRAPSSRVKLNARAGTRYLIAVDGYYGESGFIQLELEFEESLVFPPANDNFANAISLSGTFVETMGRNLAATAEAGEPAHHGFSPGPSVWWTWTAPANGPVHLSTSGSDFDTVLAVYRGTSLSFLQNVGSNDDNLIEETSSSRVYFYANQGTAYRIAVTGYSGLAGNIFLTLTQENLINGRPSNDLFAQRILLNGTASVTEGFNSGASAEPSEPNLGYQPPRATVWWSWRSPGTGSVQLQVTDAAFHPGIAVFRGHNLGTLQLIAATDGSEPKPNRLEFLAEPGASYEIAVDGPFGGQGTFLLKLSTADFHLAPVANLSRNPAAGTLSLTCEHCPDGDLILYRSEDLDFWNPVSTNTVIPGLTIDIPFQTEGMRFFRFEVE